MKIATLSSTAIVAVSAFGILPAQETRPATVERVVIRPALPYQHRAGEVHADKVIVKFAEGLRVRLVAGELTELGGADLGAARAAIGDATVERLFTRDVDDLDRERASLQGRVPPGEPALADLNNYYRVRTAGVAQSERAINALNGLATIETAYPEHIAIPLGDIPPTTPLFEGQQNWLGDAPAAYHYGALESVVGMRSPDNSMAQLEGDWHFGHEDVADLVAANIIGIAPTSYASWRNHGTACVGIMAGNRNGYGVRGMGSDTQQFYVSSLQNGADNMISLVTAVLDAGDVMSSSFAWVIQGFHAPADYLQATFDAVRAASTKGIHYTFGAGNTGKDLEDTSIYGNRYVAGSASSGGYIIGATDPGAGNRVSWSNFGATHVIANGWGSGVTTLGYGGLFDPGDVRQRYTNTFGGTSAAGPQVAAVIAAFVGAVRAQSGQILTVADVKGALAVTGTVVTGNIGARPDLRQLLALHGLPDGLLVTQNAAPGASFQYEVSGQVGDQWGAFLSTGRGNVNLGLNRDFLLDAGVLLFLGSGTLAVGSDTRTVQVPADPNLADSDWYVQLVMSRSSNLELSNSATLWIR